MHELSLCQSVIDLLEQEAQVCHYRRIKKIFFRKGVLANIEWSAFCFCFEVAAQGTVAEGAFLELEEYCAQARCEHCGQIVQIHRWCDPCSFCGETSLKILSGQMFEIESLEVEDYV